MIERYSTQEISNIWSRQAKYERWLEVELAICEAYAEKGEIPQEALQFIRERAQFDLKRCDELEKITQHDLMAFVYNLSENVGEAGRYIHLGVTSYDIIDTALGMMLRDSALVILQAAKNLQATLKALGTRYADQPMMGRTHGIHAEPITFGFKIAGWYAELDRNIQRLEQAQEEVSVGKISGAVGVHAFTSPELEEKICHKLGLKPDPVSTQIINRDRHAHFVNVLALLGSGLERITTELRNLQRTEILEVQEVFEVGQTGSSAMPHKRNPWRSETVCGLARVLRSYALAMMESVTTWHERDLTNSSLERIVLPDACHLAHFMLLRVNEILQKLVILPAHMERNLKLMGDLVYSEHLMVALIQAGLSREEAYKIAQQLAAKAWDEEQDYKTLVLENPEIQKHLSPDQIQRVFDLEHHLRNVKHSYAVFQS
jgi:adenylosuccinate lyase